MKWVYNWNYRPISLACVLFAGYSFARVLEHIVASSLSKHFTMFTELNLQGQQSLFLSVKWKHNKNAP